VQSDQYKAELTSKLTTLILIFNCFRSKITHVFLWLFKAFDIIEEIKVNTGILTFFKSNFKRLSCSLLNSSMHVIPYAYYDKPDNLDMRL